ncbi:hypothetical protein [Methylobacterium nigriterrae]|uniref:hypothetical protein n=1 Tax=Methylobacterium nigriterrae TaxID=3127512 RepID=UPI0030135DA5
MKIVTPFDHEELLNLGEVANQYATYKQRREASPTREFALYYALYTYAFLSNSSLISNASEDDFLFLTGCRREAPAGQEILRVLESQAQADDYSLLRVAHDLLESDVKIRFIFNDGTGMHSIRNYAPDDWSYLRMKNTEFEFLSITLECSPEDASD